MSKLIFVDMVSSASAVLKHPVDEVWPHLLDQAELISEYKVEAIDGERNTVGELKRVGPLPGRPEFVPFFFRTMLLVPFRRFVYKAYTEDREGQYGFTGIEVLSLSDFGEDSAVTFEAYLEIQSSTMAPDELSALVNRGKQEGVAMWKRNFERLASRLGVSGAREKVPERST